MEFREKFIKELKFLDSDTFYKILWSMVKAEELKVTPDSQDWKMISEAFISKAKDFDAKSLTNMLVLLTIARDS